MAELVLITILFHNKRDIMGSFPIPPFGFFGNLLYENLFKMTFHVFNCIKACQRKLVNKFLQHFVHLKSRVNFFLTALF